MSNFVLMKPCFSYGVGSTLFAGEAPVFRQRSPKTREAYRHTAGSGRTLTYYVGPRNFIELTVPKQSDAKVVEWGTFWDAVKDGDLFFYHESDDLAKCGDATIKCGSGFKCGSDSNGDAVTTTAVTWEGDEFVAEPDDEVWGYSDVSISMREYVA